RVLFRSRRCAAQPGADGATVLPGAGCGVHVLQCARIGATHHGQQWGGVPGGWAVQGGAPPALGAFTVTRHVFGQGRVQVFLRGCLGQGPVTGDRRENSGLELSGVGTYQDPARVRPYRPAYGLGGLQGPTTPGGPAPRDDAADDVVGVETAQHLPARSFPSTLTGVEPGPPAGRVQAGKFIVTKQQWGRRVIHLFEDPRAGGVHRVTRPGQCPEDLGRGVRVEVVPEGPGDAGRQVGEFTRTVPGLWSWSEEFGEDLVVYIGPPGQAVVAHLRGGEP